MIMFGREVSPKHHLRVSLEQNPPKKPLNSLRAMTLDFKWRRTFVWRDTIIDACAKATSLNQAITLACNSIMPETGKVCRHQCKVRRENRDKLRDTLISRRGLKSILTFDDWYDMMEGLDIYGIGPVTLYDVSVRVAAYLELPVTSLYLHADVSKAAKELGLFTGRAPKRIPHSDLPASIRENLTLDETEDFICFYSGMFRTLEDRN